MHRVGRGARLVEVAPLAIGRYAVAGREAFRLREDFHEAGPVIARHVLKDVPNGARVFVRLAKSVEDVVGVNGSVGARAAAEVLHVEHGGRGVVDSGRDACYGAVQGGKGDLVGCDLPMRGAVVQRPFHYLLS